MGNSANKEENYDYRKGEVATNYTVDKVLGSGSFGKVKLVRLKSDPTKTFALKEVHYGGIFNESTKEMIAKEIAVQQTFRHPNITKLEKCWYERGKLYGGNGYILLEYCSKGCARNLAPHQSTKIPKPASIWRYTIDEFSHVLLCWAFTEQMLSALSYVHKRDVIHRDIKLENILIHGDGSFKLTDFGLSTGRSEQLAEMKQNFQAPDTEHKLNKESMRSRSACGTLLYMAPEMFSGEGYGKAVDLYALGLCIREMVSHRSVISDPSYDFKRVLQQRGAIVDRPLVPLYVVLITYATVILYKYVFFTFLGVHLLLFAGTTVVLAIAPLAKLSELLTDSNPAARLTANTNLQHLRSYKYVLTKVYPVLLAVIVILFPYDVRGYQFARFLTKAVLFIHALFYTYLWSRRIVLF